MTKNDAPPPLTVVGTYGLWDAKEHQWLGQGPKGPNTYTDQDLARAAAFIAGEMLKLPLGQIRARPFPAGDKLVKVRSEKVRRSFNAVWKQIKQDAGRA